MFQQTNEAMHMPQGLPPGMPPIEPVVTPAPKPDDGPNLCELALESCMEAGGDTAAGAEHLAAVLRRKHKAFVREKMGELFSLWCQDQMRSARTRWRSRISTAPRGAMTTAHQQVNEASIRAAGMAWLDWPVLPGVTLGEAKRSDLMAASDNYMRNADTYMKRGGWLKAIADALPDDDAAVGDALDEKRVAEMAQRFGVAV